MSLRIVPLPLANDTMHVVYRILRALKMETLLTNELRKSGLCSGRQQWQQRLTMRDLKELTICREI
jgi:hypothetical protein